MPLGEWGEGAEVWVDAPTTTSGVAGGEIDNYYSATIVFRVFKVTIAYRNRYQNINNMNKEFNSLGGRMGANSTEDVELRVIMMMMMKMMTIDNCN